MRDDAELDEPAATSASSAHEAAEAPRAARRGGIASAFAVVIVVAVWLAPASREAGAGTPGLTATTLAAKDTAPGSGKPPTTARLAAPPQPSARMLRRKRLAAAASWRYQLRRIDPAQIAASSADLVVIDYAPDRVYGVELPFSRTDVERMRKKPGGGDKILLAYLSIGEAERYRTYWNNAWYDAPTRPAWLLDANKDWDGNFAVRFWDRDWQAIVFGTPDAYLDRILAAGFDGVYLDRADIFQELQKERADTEVQMADFIARLAAHARRINPDALVVMQNAEELVRRAAVRNAIDGLAKEDLFYGVHHDEAPNEPAMVRDTLADLRFARDSGLVVFVVEYLSSAVVGERAGRDIAKAGFLPLIAERSLGTLDFEPAPAPPAASPEATAPSPDATAPDALAPADPTLRAPARTIPGPLQP